MTFDSPNLGLILLPMAVAVMALSGRLSPLPRWLIRLAMVFALLAIAGLNVDRQRPLKIAVMVDYSPSTRGATFRDAAAVTARLTPLLAGRAYEIRYFADGELASPVEPACERTRLPTAGDADAIVLMSDGRLTAATGLPPVYAVIDPVLDSPADARVTDIQPAAEKGSVIVDVVGDGNRTLAVGGNVGAPLTPAAGPQRLAVTVGDLSTVEATFGPGDRWPENDAMRTARATTPVRRLAVGVDVSGFAAASPAGLAADAAAYVDTVVVAVDSREKLSTMSIAALTSFVRDLGGTVVLVGPPGGAMAKLSPLASRPPAGPQAWTILLDASGSMAGPADAGGTRWAAALAAARAAIDRLPDDARIDVLTFSDATRSIATGATPSEATRRLAEVADRPPAGPTGLRAALEAVATQAGGRPTRVLLLTDGDAELGDAEALAAAMNRSRITLDSVSGTAAEALAKLCTATGGAAVTDIGPARWAEALGGLVDAPGPAVESPAPVPGRDEWAGRTIAFGRVWPAWAKRDSRVIAELNGGAVAAVWPVGVGRIVAVAADAPPAVWAEAILTLERTASDARFVVTWDESAGRVRLVARDETGPISAVRPGLTRGETRTPFTLVSPGVYEADVARSPASSVGVVAVDGIVVARRSLAGRYAAEFDAVGNDGDALRRLADRTGGRLIQPGDVRPIEFTPRLVRHALRPVLSVVAAVLMVAAVVAVRFDRRQKPQ